MKAKIYRDKAGEWRWRLQSGNNRIVATSGEGYTRKRDAERAWYRVERDVSFFVVEVEVQEASE